MPPPHKQLLTDLAWALSGALLTAAVIVASNFATTDIGDSQTRNLIRLSLAWYAAALALMIRLRPADWSATTRLGSAARWCWTWACLCFLIHLGMAFHYFHHWSHADAFEHTRQVSGMGEGIYVSYLFTVLWAIDVAFWWIAPAHYATRSPWIDRALHTFMLFVVFNGAVIFESGPIRYAAAITLTALAILWLASRVYRTPADSRGFLLPGAQMTPAQFESKVADRFPELANDVAENRGLLHVVMGHLYRYAQEHIADGRWSEVDRVFRFLDEAYIASKPNTEIENAIRVSFLEYFEFQGHELEVRRILGPTLTQLYEDQTRYMDDLASRTAKSTAPPAAQARP